MAESIQQNFGFTEIVILITLLYLFSLSSVLVGLIYPSQEFRDFISSDQNFTSSNITFDDDVCIVGEAKFNQIQIEGDISFQNLEANDTLSIEDIELINLQTEKLILNGSITLETNNIITQSITAVNLNVENTTTVSTISIQEETQQNGPIVLNNQTNFMGELLLNQFSMMSRYIVGSSNGDLSSLGQVVEATWSPTIIPSLGTFTGTATTPVARYFRIEDFIGLQLRIEGLSFSTTGSRIVLSFTWPIAQTNPGDPAFGYGSAYLNTFSSISPVFCSDLTGATATTGALSMQFPSALTSGAFTLDAQCFYRL